MNETEKLKEKINIEINNNRMLRAKIKKLKLENSKLKKVIESSTNRTFNSLEKQITIFELLEGEN